jgi:pectate lyase
VTTRPPAPYPCRPGPRTRRLFAAVVTLACALLTAPPASALPDEPVAESPRLAAVRTFLDNVLTHGRDRWSGEETPLLADGINVLTKDPVEWIYDATEGRGGESGRWIVHNLANQQRLLRTLVGFSNLTGEPRYRDAARAVIRYHFDHLRSESGLFHWGTHQFIDLRTLRPVDHRPFSPSARTHVHELRYVLPFYELMWEVDPKATATFVAAQWNTQVSDWRRLDLRDNAGYAPLVSGAWDAAYQTPPPFFESEGTTTLSVGLDLLYSAASLHALGGDPAPLTWARRLAGLYVQAGHPQTGISATRYNRYRRSETPPSSGPVPNRTAMGDRAENQLGAAFPEVSREGWALFRQNVYGPPALAQLELAERLGPAGEPFLRETVANLKAYARHAYDAENHRYRPIWADGTDVTGYQLPRTGYYGRRGDVLTPYAPTVLQFLTFARAYRLAPDDELWNVVHAMGRGFELGDFGDSPDRPGAMRLDTGHSRPESLLALLEVHRASANPAWLGFAERIADNLVERSFHDGYFLLDRRHLHARFDALEPYAVLALEAARAGRPEAVPPFSGGRNYLLGWYAGYGRTYDNEAIWSRHRPPVPFAEP